jgi:predicted PhzF superfamily epimerase YddE/YHI9
VSELHVLRVFCSDDGAGGNPLGVFLDPADIVDPQAVAADLGFSETVFVEDAIRGEIRIFTPAVELPFAGHPTVGTAWLLRAELLRPPAGEVPAWSDRDRAGVSAWPEWGPEFDFQQLASPGEVDALDGPPDGQDALGAWAWIDEPAGVVRERVFPVRYGIAEDEATGAAALRLAAMLERPLDIRQGRASRILARPLSNGMVEISGRVALAEVRPYAGPEPG